MKGKHVVIVATLDTKGEEGTYIKDLVLKKGHIPMLVDTGVFDSPYSSHANIDNEAVARSIGLTMEEIRDGKRVGGAGEGEAIALMIKGACTVVQQLLTEGKMQGLLCIGGSMGTSVGSAVMKDIPFNIPKVMLSTVAFTPLIPFGSGSIDQMLMQTIADLRGLNTLTKLTMKRAVDALCGIIEGQEKTIKKKPIIGVTGLGGHKIVEYCVDLLNQRGFEGIVFHSIGANSAEKLIKEGFVDGMLDLCVFELVNMVCGGDVGGSEEKITAGCEKGIPQLISAGAIDFFAWSRGVDAMPPEYKKRNFEIHNPMVILVPTNDEEKSAVLDLMIERVNKANGPTIVLVPLKGFSRLDKEGMPFHDSSVPKRVYDELKGRITNSVVEVMKIDAHINDPFFGETAVDLFTELYNRKHQKGHVVKKRAFLNPRG